MGGGNVSFEGPREPPEAKRGVSLADLQDAVNEDLGPRHVDAARGPHLVEKRQSPRQDAIDAILRREVSENIARRYGESNRRTAALIGVDLRGYGYQS